MFPARTTLYHGILAASKETPTTLPLPHLHYKLDDATQGTTLDSSLNGFDGSYSGTTTLQQTPIHPDGGYSAQFDGIDDRVVGVECYGGVIASAKYPATISLKTNFTDMATEHALFATNSRATEWRGITMFVTASGVIRVVIGNGFRSVSNYRQWTIAAGLTSGVDYHIAMKLTDQSTLTVWVDGVQQNVGTYSDGGGWTGDMGTSVGALVLGNAKTNTTSDEVWLKGRLDDFRLYLEDMDSAAIAKINNDIA